MKVYNILAIILFIATIYSCDDIIEEDISDNSVVQLSPSDNSQIESNVVNFAWERVTGADNYRLQVFSPGQNVTIDTLVKKESFVLALSPGTYQWRVRGENFAYETPYTFPRNFTLIESEDLSNQQVPLLYPGAGAYLKRDNLIFSWSALKNATGYSYQLIDAGNGNVLLHENTSLSGNSYTLPNEIINQDGIYLWKVKAINSENSTETTYSSRNFYIDTTAPNIPVNSLPQHNSQQNVNETIDFSWSTSSDSGSVNSPVTYFIQISSNNTFTEIIHSSASADASYSYIFSVKGEYFWRVKAIDASDNNSAYSNFYKITIQ